MFSRAAGVGLVVFAVAVTATAGGQTQETDVVEREDSFTVGNSIIYLKRTGRRDPVACLFHGLITPEEAIAVKDAIGEGPLCLNLEMAYVALLIENGSPAEALRILDKNKPWQGNEQK